MKVLHVIPGYEPAWGFGGTVTSVRNLCTSLVERGVDVTVYTTNADGDGGRMDVSSSPREVSGVTVRYFNCTVSPKRAFYSRGLSRALSNNVDEFDLVHSSTVWQWHQRAVFKHCQRANVPYILTPHSCLMESAVEGVGMTRLKRPYWRSVVKPTIEGADAVHFLSEVERERSERYAGSGRSFIVPNGLDVDQYHIDPDAEKEIRTSLGLADDDFVVLFLGRITPKKRIDRILEALPNLIGTHDHVRLVVAGYVDDTDYLRQLKRKAVELGVDSHVLWHGPVDSERIRKFYSIGDLMALPSDIEGISMALLEAMAAGTPVLVSDRVGNYRTIAEENAGVVVEPTSRAVREALESLVPNTERLQTLRYNALELVREQYTNDAVAAAMMAAYEDIIGDTTSAKIRWST